MSSDWVGVIGGVVGGTTAIVGGLLLQSLINRQQQRASTDAWRREDHLRFVTERRNLYASWLAVWRDVLEQVYEIYQLELVGESSSGEPRAQFGSRLQVLRQIGLEMELTASDDVREVTATTLAFLRTGLFLQAKTANAQSIQDHWRDRLRSLEQLAARFLSAARADLTVQKSGSPS